jgi:hypothetical protein
LTLPNGKKPRQISCYWKEGDGWEVNLEQNTGTWMSYNWVKMYGNQKIEVSKDYFFLPE